MVERSALALRGMALMVGRPKISCGSPKPKGVYLRKSSRRVTSVFQKTLALFVSLLGQGRPERLGQVRHLFR